MLAERRSEQLFTVRWRARGAVGFQGDRNVGTLLCPASPRFAVRSAPCRPDPPVGRPSFGLDSYFDLVRLILSDNVFVDELITGRELVDDLVENPDPAMLEDMFLTCGWTNMLRGYER